MPEMKPGIKLSKTDSQWKTANKHFHSMLPMSLIEIIYDYFKDNYGIFETMQQSQWKEIYDPMHKKELKSCLRNLKRNQAPYTEIKYVSRLL